VGFRSKKIWNGGLSIAVPTSFCLPHLIGLDQVVECGDEFPHARNDGNNVANDFRGLQDLDRPLVFGVRFEHLDEFFVNAFLARFVADL
jgi:hypothetical protein